MSILELDYCGKIYFQGNTRIHAVHPTVIKFEEGVSMIYGKGGAGKSTLLHMMAGMEPPSDGKIYYEGMSLYDDIDLSSLHRKDFSYIGQANNLIREFNIKDNILMPLRFDGVKGVAIFEELVEVLDLQETLDMRPQSLAIDRQQRVALARALINGPKILFADEPTEHMSEAETEAYMTVMLELCKKYGVSLIMTTQDADLLAYAQHTYRMKDGDLTAEQ